MGGQAKQQMYTHQAPYADPQGVYSTSYGDGSQMPTAMPYGTMATSSSALDAHSYQTGGVFHTPPAVAASVPQSASPADSYQHESYPQTDLSGLLGSLRMNEIGTGLSRPVKRPGGKIMLTGYQSTLSEQQVRAQRPGGR